jgi:endoribonuclease LACTB2
MKIISYDDLVQAEFINKFAGQQLSVSVYFIDGLLIDTGPSKVNEKLTPLLNEWQINEVILTHHHEDHTGAARWIQDNKKVPIYIHETGVDFCNNRMRLPFYRKVFWGERAPFEALPLEKTFETPNYSWDIIHSPGHSHDHIVLYNREKKWLFGGDLYVQSRPRSLFAFESIPEIISSLRLILTYDFETYICSHAGFIPSGRIVIEDKLAYLEKIYQEVLSMHEKGKTNREIRKELFPKSHPMNYFSLFENSPIHIVNSILK